MKPSFEVSVLPFRFISEQMLTTPKYISFIIAFSQTYSKYLDLNKTFSNLTFPKFCIHLNDYIH